MIAIIGANGSMGKRYQAILEHLKEPFSCFDQETEHNKILKAAILSKGVILCTPTDTHSKFLHDLITVRVKRILCEKPIVKNPGDLADIYARADEADVDLKMVFQYTYKAINSDDGEGDSYYNFFRHGNDGLIWDCLQIIGLARGKVFVYENSPIWQCILNGKKVNFASMDKAYVWFVSEWLKGKIKQSPREIIEIHQKCLTMEKEHDIRNKGFDRHSS